MQKELPVRKNIRLKDYDYSQDGCYFITICVKDRHEMLGQVVGTATCRPFVKLSDIGQIIDKSINNIPDIYSHISVDKYIIMPNHIHILLRVCASKGGRQIAVPTSVQTVIGNMKRYVSMQLGFSLWQPRFYDHIIRDEADYQTKWRYIDENPVRWAEDEYHR